MENKEKLDIQLEELQDICNKLEMINSVIDTATNCTSENITIDEDAVLKLWQTTFISKPMVRDILKKN